MKFFRVNWDFWEWHKKRFVENCFSLYSRLPLLVVLINILFFDFRLKAYWLWSSHLEPIFLWNIPSEMKSYSTWRSRPLSIETLLLKIVSWTTKNNVVQNKNIVFIYRKVFNKDFLGVTQESFLELFTFVFILKITIIIKYQSESLLTMRFILEQFFCEIFPLKWSHTPENCSWKPTKKTADFGSYNQN